MLTGIGIVASRENPWPVMERLLMLSAAVPEFASVTLLLMDDPTVTSPKAIEDGEYVSTPEAELTTNPPHPHREEHRPNIRTNDNCIFARRAAVMRRFSTEPRDLRIKAFRKPISAGLVTKRTGGRTLSGTTRYHLWNDRAFQGKAKEVCVGFLLSAICQPLGLVRNSIAKYAITSNLGTRISGHHAL